VPSRSTANSAPARGAPARDGGSDALPVAARIAFILVAAILLATALIRPEFRNAEGFFSGAIIVPIALAIGAAVSALPRAVSLTAAYFWFGLAFFGSAVSLQLIDAGNLVGYQHYAPWQRLISEKAPYLVFLGIESALVLWALGPRLGAWLGRLRAAFGYPGLIAVLLVCGLTSATLSSRVSVFVAELVFAALVQFVHLGAFVAGVLTLPDATVRAWTDRLSQIFGPPSADGRAQPGGVDRFSCALAAWVLVMCALLALFSYQRHPHVPDEAVYLYPARYFARGMLTMPLPPVPEAFNLDLMTYEATRWYSPVPPGWPAVLSLGVSLGAAWLVNPVLNALNILLGYVVLRDLYDVRTARIATLLLSVSPWFLFMGMNFMTHTWTLTCLLGGAAAVARMRRTHDSGKHMSSFGWAVLAGAAIGMLGLIRPLEGLTVAALLGLWALFAAPTRWRIAPCLVMALAALAMVSVTFPYNAALTGNPRVFPLLAYTDSVYGKGVNALGFGPNKGLPWPGLDPLPGHGVLDVLINANLNAFMVNIDLFGWGTGSLLFLAALLASCRLRRPDWLMLVTIIAIAGVHSFYWFSGGPDFGARYWYLILVPCIALTARGIDETGRLLSARPDPTSARTRSLVLALALCAVSLATFIPWRAIDKYHHYRRMRPDIRQLARRLDWGPVLVIVRGNRHPDYASAAIYNPIDLMAPVPVYAWERNPDVTKRVLAAYPDRDVWLVDGPSYTQAGYRVRRGPVSARVLQAELEAGVAR
jgi:hypothetical protein